MYYDVVDDLIDCIYTIMAMVNLSQRTMCQYREVLLTRSQVYSNGEIVYKKKYEI